MNDIGLEDIQYAVNASGLKGFTGRFVELGGGEVNDTFLLDCEDEKTVLRITRYKDVANLHREAKALRMLHISNVPKVLYFDETSKIKGRAWILESYIEGARVADLTLPQYESLGSLLALVHNLKSENQTINDLWTSFLVASQSFGTEEDFLHHPDEEIRGLVNRAKPYFINQTDRIGYIRKSLVHGDATPGNILVKDNTVSLIDWELSTFKDPMSDFSTIFYEDMEFNKGRWRVHIRPEQRQALFDGYRQAGGVIDEPRIAIWINLDKLGAALYLYWLLNESGRSYSNAQVAQYQLDLNNLVGSLKKNFS